MFYFRVDKAIFLPDRAMYTARTISTTSFWNTSIDIIPFLHWIVAIFGHLHGTKSYFEYFIEPIPFLPEYETEVLVLVEELVEVPVEVPVEVLVEVPDLVTG